MHQAPAAGLPLWFLPAVVQGVASGVGGAGAAYGLKKAFGGVPVAGGVRQSERAMPLGKNVGVNTGVRFGNVAEYLRRAQSAGSRGAAPTQRQMPAGVRRDAYEHYVWEPLTSKPRVHRN